MKEFRRVLSDAKRIVLERAPPQAALCNDIQRALPWVRRKVKRPFIFRKDLPELVARGRSGWFSTFDKNVLVSHDDLLDAALQQMSDACEVLSFPDNEAFKLKDVVVINPSWLLEEVVGILLSPTHFPPPRVEYDDHGRAERGLTEQVLEKKFAKKAEQGFLTGSASLEMVSQLGICVFDKENIVVPSKFKTCRTVKAIFPATYGNEPSVI